MADEKDTDIDQGKTQESAAETTAQEQGKTFTQAEVDKIISDRLKREREKLPASEFNHQCLVELSHLTGWVYRRIPYHD